MDYAQSNLEKVLSACAGVARSRFLAPVFHARLLNPTIDGLPPHGGRGDRGAEGYNVEFRRQFGGRRR